MCVRDHLSNFICQNLPLSKMNVLCFAVCVLFCVEYIAQLTLADLFTSLALVNSKYLGYQVFLCKL